MDNHLFHAEGDSFVVEIDGKKYIFEKTALPFGLSTFLYELHSTITVFNTMFLDQHRLSMLAQQDITDPERHALVKIYDLKMTTMGKLATACGFAPSKTTRYVDSLIKKGLVQRSYNENNRRIVLVSATEKGTALVKAYIRSIFDQYDTLIKNIPDEDRAILADSYIKMIAIYKKYCNLPVVPEEL